MRQSPNQLDLYAPCPCGSGKKYKFCCRDRDRQRRRDSSEAAWPETSGSKPPDNVVILDLEASEQLNEEGARALNEGRFALAERHFRAAIKASPLIPIAWNNLALALFAQGKIAEAIEMQEKAVGNAPYPNVFGMSNLVQFYQAVGRDDDADRTADQALETTPDTPPALTKTFEALARLGRHQDILDCAEKKRTMLDCMGRWFAGTAAANLGQKDRALEHLRLIGYNPPYGERAKKRISALEKDMGPGTLEDDWPYFLAQDLLPPGIRDALARAEEAGEKLPPLLKSRALVDALVTLLNEDGGSKVDAVEMLGEIRHPRATEVLIKIATGMFGSDDLRLAAFRHLTRKGVWSQTEPHRLWLKGEWRDLVSLGWNISGEQSASNRDVDENMLPVHEDAVNAARRGKWRKSAKLNRKIIESCPDFTAAHYNLGVALLQLRQDDEAEACLRRAMSMEPEYLFAPSTLVVLLLDSGQLAEARQVMTDIVVPDPVHPDALASYLTAQVRVFFAEDQVEAAVSWLEMAERVAPDNHVVKHLSKTLALYRKADDLLWNKDAAT